MNPTHDHEAQPANIEKTGRPRPRLRYLEKTRQNGVNEARIGSSETDA